MAVDLVSTPTSTSSAAQAHARPDASASDCCIVGAGPAGAVLALLLVRQGVAVTLLEAHADLQREFRGDTIHPSTLALMDQLGLLDRLLALPHTRHSTLRLHTPTGSAPYLDFSQLRAKHPYLLRLPQARFLELLTHEAGRYPGFRLVMSARVEELIEQDAVIQGVRYRTQDGLHELQAGLVVGADGRFSRVRELAHLPRTSTVQPVDVLWFRLPSSPADPATDGGIYVGHAGFGFIRNRGQEWQVAYLLPKGGYQRLRTAGLDSVRRSISELVPWLADRTPLLQDWRQTSLLAVESSYVRRWYGPGLLVIGDAAHVMSPVGGVGINLAIQDAVVAANVLAAPLRRGAPRVQDLAAVQRRRDWSTRLIQVLQDLLLQHVLSTGQGRTPPLAARVVESTPCLRACRTRLFAFGGLWPEQVTGERRGPNESSTRLAAPGAVAAQKLCSTKRA